MAKNDNKNENIDGTIDGISQFISDTFPEMGNKDDVEELLKDKGLVPQESENNQADFQDKKDADSGESPEAKDAGDSKVSKKDDDGASASSKKDDESAKDEAKKKGKRTRKVSLKNLGEDVSIIPVEQMLPPKLSIIPVAGRPMFPGIFTPVMINSGQDSKTIEEAYEGDGFIGLVMLKDDDAKDGDKTPTIKDLYTVGTVARIIKKINLPDGGVNLYFHNQTLQNQKDFKCFQSYCGCR